MCVVFLQVSSEMTRARAEEHWEELVYIVLYNALLWDGVRELIFNTRLVYKSVLFGCHFAGLK